MSIDVVRPDGTAVDVGEAISDVALEAHAELIGRLVQVLVDKRLLDAGDIRQILPQSYKVRQ